MLNNNDISLLSHATVSHYLSTNNNQITIVTMITAFERLGHLYQFPVTTEIIDDIINQSDEQRELSYFHVSKMDNLENNSHILEYKMKAVSITTKIEIPRSGDWEQPKIDKNGRLKDLPITFHNRIKSSGYGQTTQDLFLKKQLQKQKEKQKQLIQLKKEKLLKANQQNNNSDNNNENVNRKQSILMQTNGKLGPLVGARIRSYPLDCQPMTLHQVHQNYPSTTTNNTATRQMPPISRILFNRDASVLGMANVDSTVTTLRLPTSNYSCEGTIIIFIDLMSLTQLFIYF